MFSFKPLFVFAVFFLIGTNGTQAFSIAGKVTDKESGLIEMGNMLILSPTDVGLSTENAFANERFRTNGTHASPVRLKITASGYQNHYQIITNSDSLEAGPVLLPVNAPDRSEGYTTKPVFESGAQQMVKINVEGSVTGSDQNAATILAKFPGVAVTDHDVEITGKGKAVLYLDGKRINHERLITIPAGQIKEIQIITHPSAKFDEGKAVVNIISSDHPVEGWQGKAIVNYIRAKQHPAETAELDLNYCKGKFSMDGHYHLALGHESHESSFARKLTQPDGIYVSHADHKESKHLTNESSYRFGIKYKLSSHTNVAVKYNGLYHLFGLNAKSYHTVGLKADSATTLKALSESHFLKRSNGVQLDFNTVLDTLGSNLSLSGQYAAFHNKQEGHISEEITTPHDAVGKTEHSNDELGIKGLLTSQLDYTKNFANGSHFEAGLKYTHAHHSGEMAFFSKTHQAEETEVFVFNPFLSHDFEYEKSLSAGYLQYKGSVKQKMTYTLGLRAEHTVAKSESKILDRAWMDTTYTKFFPSASIKGKINGMDMGLAYSTHINHPEYRSLNPFVHYDDLLTSVQGNPELLPEVTNSTEASFGYLQYSLKLGWNVTSYAHRLGVFPDNPEGGPGVVLKTINVDRVNSYFATLALPIQIEKVKYWSSYNSISYTINQLEDYRPMFASGKAKGFFHLYSHHKFQVKKWFDLEVFGVYEGPQSDGVYKRSGVYSVNGGISKKMASNNLVVRITANDILETYHPKVEYVLGSADVTESHVLETSFYRLSIICRFGSKKLQQIAHNSHKEEHGGMDEGLHSAKHH